MTGLPDTNCLCVAIATPLTPDYHPDAPRLVAHAEWLRETGADGFALFGTTGEGAELSVADRTGTLEAVIAAGMDPRRIVVSVGALAIPDVVALSEHAMACGVDGVMLMPPPMFRSGLTEESIFRFYATVIDRIGDDALRLYLYHFPDICGAPITPQVIRRLSERYGRIVAGVKDSGGDLGFTRDLVRRFSHLSIFTGSEPHLPELLGTGLRGTICGMANVMPRLLRQMVDAPTAFDRRAMLPDLLRADAILSRRPFVAMAKATIADRLDDPEWRRVIPPLPEVPLLERQLLAADFRAWDAGLPPAQQSLSPRHAPVDNIVDLRRA